MLKIVYMDITAVITSLLTLLAGIGVFLIACQMMSSNLEAASSEKLKKLFSKASGSKMLGVGIGALGTAAIQSSGATTVMTIGFVNAGIISLTQAATIIYGARMEKGICTPSVGAQYLELSSNAERMADHMINIAKSIRAL